MKRLHPAAICASALLVAVAIGGCDEVRQLEFGIPASGGQKWGELNPMDEMQNQPSIHPQKIGMRQFAPGTIATNETPYPEEAIADPNLAVMIHNPMPITKESLLRGQDLYDTYCVVCHGERGLGNGYIIPKYPKPPSLTSTKLRGFEDGQIYHIITNGQNIMPHYRGQIRPMERWAIVNYVRALQRAEYPEKKDAARVKVNN